jgi:GxxExxY protein
MKQMNYMNENGFTAKDDPFTAKIIGLAIRVHKELGPGFLEAVYHKALMIELEEAGVDYQTGVPLEVFYRGRPAGTFVADLIIEKRLLLELKAIDVVASIHESQVVNYLKATGIDLGLLLNFGAAKLQVKRKFREHPVPVSDLRLHEV